MKLNELTKIKKDKAKIVGRGESSGKGKTSTKGMKGQKSRGRGKIRLGFEGGQLPLIKRLPFRRGVGGNKARANVTITLDQLRIFADNETVNQESMLKKGLLSKSLKPNYVKIVAKGEITKPLKIEVLTTKKAKEMIEKAKGQVLVTNKEKVNA